MYVYSVQFDKNFIGNKKIFQVFNEKYYKFSQKNIYDLIENFSKKTVLQYIKLKYNSDELSNVVENDIFTTLNYNNSDIKKQHKKKVVQNGLKSKFTFRFTILPEKKVYCNGKICNNIQIETRVFLRVPENKILIFNYIKSNNTFSNNNYEWTFMEMYSTCMICNTFHTMFHKSQITNSLKHSNCNNVINED